MNTAGNLISEVVRNPLGNRFMTVLENLQKERPNCPRILTYHMVENLEGFEQQMRYLAENYNVVTMKQLLDAVVGGDSLPLRSLLITFDDAYRNFSEKVWPILKKYALPATMFVPTAFPGDPEKIFWWDRLKAAFRNTDRRDSIQTPIGEVSLATDVEREQAYHRLKKYMNRMSYNEIMGWTYQLCKELNYDSVESQTMDWHELNKLASEGVTLGAHSQTHPFMDQISPKEMEEEAAGSLEDLKRQVGDVLPIFAYPGGRFSEETVQMLKSVGFILGFTTTRGVNDLEQANPLLLRRINIGEQATLPVLRARLLHASHYLNQLRPLPN